MKRRSWPAAAAALAAALAVGCGSTAPSTPASGPVIAHKLGCAGGYQDVGPDAFTKDEGTCGTWAHGNSASIYLFSSQRDETTWLATPGSGVAVTGHLWIVTVANDAQAGQVVSLLGGTAH